MNKSVGKATRMSVMGDPPRENNFPGRKTINAESRVSSSSPEAEIEKSSNLQLSEKLLNLSNIQPKVRRKLPSVPSLQLTEKRILPSIPVNEIKKVRQRPGRVLPCLPPVVQEILRWSIHSQKVLRVAASVSHLLKLPTIEEESLPSVQPTRPKVKRILPSVPPTENRALPSNQPTVASKPLPPYRAAFRKRMVPSLPKIKERTSPRLPEVKSPHGNKEASQYPGFHPAEKKEVPQSIKKRKVTKQQRRKPKVDRSRTGLQPAEKEEMVDCKLISSENLRSFEETMMQEHPRSSGRGSTAEPAERSTKGEVNSEESPAGRIGRNAAKTSNIKTNKGHSSVPRKRRRADYVPEGEPTPVRAFYRETVMYGRTLRGKKLKRCRIFVQN